MAIITDFFVASKNEFEQCFEDWLPVAAEKYIEITNPYTQETYLDWGPDPAALAMAQAKKEQALAQQLEKSEGKKPGFLSRLFGSKKGIQPQYIPPDISSFPHVNYYRVDLIKLATLYSILGTLSIDDALDQLAKPAYILPDSNEQGIHMIPEDYLNLLAKIGEGDMERAENHWLQTDELQMDGFTLEDSHEVLLALRDLAKTAVSEEKHLFHWWCV